MLTNSLHDRGRLSTWVKTTKNLKINTPRGPGPTRHGPVPSHRMAPVTARSYAKRRSWEAPLHLSGGARQSPALYSLTLTSRKERAQALQEGQPQERRSPASSKATTQFYRGTLQARGHRGLLEETTQSFLLAYLHPAGRGSTMKTCVKALVHFLN